MSDCDRPPVSPPPNFVVNRATSCRSDRGECGTSSGRGQALQQPSEVLVGEIGAEMLQAEVEEEVERTARLPTYSPTRSEMEEHAVTHTPYRPWCKFCAEGRGQEHGHHR